MTDILIYDRKIVSMISSSYTLGREGEKTRIEYIEAQNLHFSSASSEMYKGAKIQSAILDIPFKDFMRGLEAAKKAGVIPDMTVGGVAELKRALADLDEGAAPPTQSWKKIIGPEDTLDLAFSVFLKAFNDAKAKGQVTDFTFEDIQKLKEKPATPDAGWKQNTGP